RRAVHISAAVAVRRDAWLVRVPQRRPALGAPAPLRPDQQAIRRRCDKPERPTQPAHARCAGLVPRDRWLAVPLPWNVDTVWLADRGRGGRRRIAGVVGGLHRVRPRLPGNARTAHSPCRFRSLRHDGRRVLHPASAPRVLPDGEQWRTCRAVLFLLPAARLRRRWRVRAGRPHRLAACTACLTLGATSLVVCVTGWGLLPV